MVTEITRQSPDNKELTSTLPVVLRKITRGEENKGKEYYALDVNEGNFLEAVKFVGIRQATRRFKGWFNQKGYGWQIASEKENNGVMLEADWISAAQKFSGRGENIEDLKSLQLDLLDEMVELGDSPEDEKRKKEILIEVRANKEEIERRKETYSKAREAIAEATSGSTKTAVAA